MSMRIRAALTILLTALPGAATADDCIAATPESTERPMRRLDVKVRATTFEAERVLLVKLTNRDKAPAVGTQLTLVDAAGQPMMPAHYSGNCLTVPPGEPIMITIRYSPDIGNPSEVRVQSWNTKPASARVPADPAPAQVYLPPSQQQIYTPPAPTVKSATVVIPKR